MLPANPPKPDTAPPATLIQLVACSKSYGRGDARIDAVRDVSLEVNPGEFLVITGRSGSGKSTLLNLMGALETATRGEVLIAGRSTSALSDSQLSALRREFVTSIFQSFNLLPTLTVEENIALPARLSNSRGRHLRERVIGLLEQVDLLPRRNAWPDELSGGEMQRVAVARALVNRPAVILADEPTGNLDTRSAGRVLDLLEDVVREGTATVVLVTHSAEAARRGNRRIRIEDGVVLPPEP